MLVLCAEVWGAPGDRERDSGYGSMKLYTDVMEIIRQHYVDKDKTAYDQLTRNALKGMLSGLDPHSQYMSPEVYAAMKDETDGQFGGIGLVVGVKDGAITVIAPMNGTPGAKAGIRAGDRILRVDGKVTDKMGPADVAKRFRGLVGTKCTVSIYRPETNEIIEQTLTRAIIKVESVVDVQTLPVSSAGGERIGYVRVTQFNEPTADEFEKALRELEKDGITALVIDVRNNPGGLLETAAECAGKFIPPGELIVSTEGQNPLDRTLLRSKAEPKHTGYPIAVLVNAGTASGAEILAGALKDLRKAVLVGETTFGKGSVQSILPLPDRSAIRLTTAKYYTPAHHVIHERGVAPDLVSSLTRDEEEALMREGRGAVTSDEGDDSGTLTDAALAADAQLARAVDALRLVRQHVRRSTSPANQTALKR